MAIKLEGRGGKALMAWPLVEELFLRLPLGKPQKPLAIKIYFFLLFLFCCHFKIKNYFIYQHMDGHITLKFINMYFYWFVTIFAKKNPAILVQKFGGEKKLLKSVSW